LSVEHFPRRDDDYLAQIKKLCVDRCLTIAAVNSALPFGAGAIDPHIDELKLSIDIAERIGAPLARFACGAAEGSPGIAWRELVRGLKSACEHAKKRNVTLAVLPRAGSLISTDADVKRALKECDSAWLRLALPAVPDWEPLARDAVVMVMEPAGFDIAAALRFRGFISLEDASGADEVEHLRRWIGSLFAG
jgi:sugar phosphate isomerase/epimerase